MTRRILAVTAIVLLAAVAPATAAATRQSESAYAGSHVAFDAESNALVNYSVDGTTTMESVSVQSRSEAESGVGLDASADLEAVTDVTGAALSVRSSTRANATVTSGSGATLRAHDNGHGSLVVAAEGESQVVTVGLTNDSTAEQSGESRVVVTNEDGTQQSYVVAGDGEVTVNEDGNVSASVEEGSRLVVRSYPNDRTSEDEKQEEMIVDGTAAASVYLMQQDGETVTDTVKYGQDATVDVSERSANRVNVTVSRTASEGKVVIVSASEKVFDASDEVQVSVDGEAAARASSHAELKQAANGGSTSKYMVSQSSSAEASMDVAVALNHFSSRDVTMVSGEDGSTDQSDGSTDQSDGGSKSDGDSVDSTPTSGSGPGFGPVGALVALAAVAGIGLRRRG